jgi:hypothetical protein
MRVSQVFVAAAAAVAGSFMSVAAQASTVTFASTTTIDPVSKVSFSSTGLNATLTVGVPDTITQFVTVSVGNGEWSVSNAPITADFTFTVPTPDGTTTDGGTIAGGQANGNGNGETGTLTITWPNQPVEFDFADGTKLDVTLGGLTETCNGNNCLPNGYLSATFDVLNGPVTATPLPATLPLFAGGLGFVGYLTRRRKQALAAA